MSIQPTPEAEALIRLTIERDRRARLKDAIAVGDEQYARGQVVSWTPDFPHRLKREAAEHVRDGTPIKDEVKP